jgi:hypothetical protein
MRGSTQGAGQPSRLDQQILMIGNEMNRVQRALSRNELGPARRGYERVLRLTDLTIGAHPRPALLRELLRWRDIVAMLFCADVPTVADHRAAFRALLQLTPSAAKQIPHVLRQ